MVARNGTKPRCPLFEESFEIDHKTKRYPDPAFPIESPSPHPAAGEGAVPTTDTEFRATKVYNETESGGICFIVSATAPHPGVTLTAQVGSKMRRVIARFTLFVFSAFLAVSAHCAAPDPQQWLVTPVSRSADTTGDAGSAQSMDTVVEKVAEKAAQKAAEKTVEKAAAHAVNQVAERAAEKAVERAAADAAAQTEQVATRPEELWGATTVKFLVFVIDIDNIDDAEENFMANIFLRLRWVDPRLASPGASMREMSLDTVWNPRAILVNLTGIMTKALPDVVQVEPDGTVTYYQRYTGKLSQALHLSEFPRDRHTFTIQFAGAGYGDDQLEFVPDTWPGDPSIRGGAMAEQLSLPDWKVLSYEAAPLTYSPFKGAHSAGFALSFEAERYVDYYLWQIVLPLGIVVMMASAAFWFRREDVGVRIGIATSSVLTMIANRFVLSSLLPRLPYMTRMDYLSIGSMLLVFIALFLVVATVFLETRGKDEWTRKLDLWSRASIPTGFVLLLGWFLLL